MSTPDAPVSAEVDTADLTWVGVADAAQQTGVSAGAIHSWLARGEVRSRTGRGPRGARTEVAVQDVHDRAKVVLADGSRPPSTDVEPLADRFAQLGSLIHQSGQDMAEWRARAAAAETKLEFLTDQLAAARALPEQLRAEIAAAHADSERARADLEQTRAEAVALRAELARAGDRIAALEEQVRAPHGRCSATAGRWARRYHHGATGWERSPPPLKPIIHQMTPAGAGMTDVYSGRRHPRRDGPRVRLLFTSYKRAFRKAYRQHH